MTTWYTTADWTKHTKISINFLLFIHQASTTSPMLMAASVASTTPPDLMASRRTSAPTRRVWPAETPPTPTLRWRRPAPPSRRPPRRRLRPPRSEHDQAHRVPTLWQVTDTKSTSPCKRHHQWPQSLHHCLTQLLSSKIFPPPFLWCVCLSLLNSDGVCFYFYFFHSFFTTTLRLNSLNNHDDK